MVFGVPSMCIKTTGTPYSEATVARSASSRKAPTSLMIEAPASRARRATAALVVSMDIGIEIRLARASITGTTRRISSSTDTESENGRVDSPPISMISAPSCSSFGPGQQRFYMKKIGPRLKMNPA